ncbi:MAG: hypothetical protein IAE79_03125 [Anaerolinea sp.]|nr:hypothetical protein [Anaerolinea sp.]
MSEVPENQGKYRRRRSSRRKHQSKAVVGWLSHNGLDVLINVLFVVGILFLFDPFRFIVDPDQYTTGLGRWFFHEQGMQSLGGLGLVTAVLIGSIRLRWRINNRQQWWARGCPKCGSSDLSRIHRTWSDRLLGAVGIPLRRYTCRNCHWRGARIDDSRIRS